jgi:CDGSH-type Zn-finger protein
MEPHITACRPAFVTLEAGTHEWCTCGHSKDSRGLCDGSHIGKGFCPKLFTLEREKRVALCLCRHSQNPPYCDGTHNHLPGA